jgi:hypothetical protein
MPDVRQMINLASCGQIIFDRYHWSPIVYGEVLRNGPELNDYDVWALEGHLMNRGFVIVLCLTDVSTMLENNIKEEQLWDEVRKYGVVAKLRKAYQRLTSKTELPIKTFNYLRHTFQMVDDFIDECVDPSGPVDTLGHSQPDIWFVGDGRADLGTKGLSIPFYDTGIADKLLSGTLLWNALVENGYTWSSGVALSNSAGRDLKADYDRLGQPEKVIALGTVATKRLRDSGLGPDAMVRHPQWWRRFKYSDSAGYAKHIKEAVNL